MGPDSSLLSPVPPPVPGARQSLRSSATWVEVALDSGSSQGVGRTDILVAVPSLEPARTDGWLLDRSVRQAFARHTEAALTKITASSKASGGSQRRASSSASSHTARAPSHAGRTAVDEGTMPPLMLPLTSFWRASRRQGRSRATSSRFASLRDDGSVSDPMKLPAPAAGAFVRSGSAARRWPTQAGGRGRAAVGDAPQESPQPRSKARQLRPNSPQRVQWAGLDKAAKIRSGVWAVRAP